MKKKILLYYFHDKYLFSPGQLARSINKLIKKKIIICEDQYISATSEGNDWILANRKKIFFHIKNKYWKKIPDHMLAKEHALNKPYKPKQKLLDTIFFNGQIKR